MVYFFQKFKKSCRPKRRKMPILQVCMLRFQNSYIIEGKRWQIQRMVMIAEPKPITFENNEPSNYVEEAEALGLSPIPENEKCEFQRSEKKKHEVILWPFWFLSKRQIKQERQTHDKAIRK